MALEIRASSQLSFLAAWLVADLAVPGRVNLCNECGRPHASAAAKALFCSDACRFANAQREYRAKKPALKL